MNLNEQLLTAWSYKSAVRTKASQLLCQTLKIEQIDAFTEIQLIKKSCDYLSYSRIVLQSLVSQISV